MLTNEEFNQPTNEESNQPPSYVERESQPRTQTFLLLGNTGVGKSYIIEEMTGLKNLSGGSGHSTTQDITPYPTKSGPPVIDTPGLADTDCFSYKHLQTITSYASNILECVPVLVVDYTSKFTEEYKLCIEALSLALGLDSQQYVLIINKVQTSRRDTDNSLFEKIAEIFETVTLLIGYPPARTIKVPFNQDFDEAELTRYEYKSLKGVQSLDKLISSIKNDAARVDFINKRLLTLKSLEENHMHYSLSLFNSFKEWTVTGAGKYNMGVSAIGADWKNGERIQAASKAALLPFTAVAARLGGLFALASMPVAATGEAIVEDIKFNQNHVGQDDKAFFEDKGRRVKALEERVDRVLNFYGKPKAEEQMEQGC